MIKPIIKSRSIIQGRAIANKLRGISSPSLSEVLYEASLVAAVESVQIPRCTCSHQRPEALPQWTVVFVVSAR